MKAFGQGNQHLERRSCRPGASALGSVLSPEHRTALAQSVEARGLAQLCWEGAAGLAQGFTETSVRDWSCWGRSPCSWCCSCPCWDSHVEQGARTAAAPSLCRPRKGFAPWCTVGCPSGTGLAEAERAAQSSQGGCAHLRCGSWTRSWLLLSLALWRLHKETSPSCCCRLGTCQLLVLCCDSRAAVQDKLSQELWPRRASPQASFLSLAALKLPFN